MDNFNSIESSDEYQLRPKLIGNSDQEPSDTGLIRRRTVPVCEIVSTSLNNSKIESSVDNIKGRALTVDLNSDQMIRKLSQLSQLNVSYEGSVDLSDEIQTVETPTADSGSLLDLKKAVVYSSVVIADKQITVSYSSNQTIIVPKTHPIGSGVYKTFYLLPNSFKGEYLVFGIQNASNKIDPNKMDIEHIREVRTITRLKALEINEQSFFQLPTIYKDIGSGEFCIISKYCELGTLNAAQNQSSKMKFEILTQLYRGVAALHENGVIHCDLKPDNILLTADSSGNVLVKIADFGLSYLKGQGDESYRGSTYYMAPEVRSFKAYPSEQSDLFAMGIISFELLFTHFYSVPIKALSKEEFDSYCSSYEKSGFINQKLCSLGQPLESFSEISQKILKEISFLTCFTLSDRFLRSKTLAELYSSRIEHDEAVFKSDYLRFHQLSNHNVVQPLNNYPQNNPANNPNAIETSYIDSTSLS